MPDDVALASRLWARVRRRWRAVLRAFHRDIGYFIVGLTFVYAVSGIAINHIDDWDPNFERSERVIELGEELPAETADAVAIISDAVGFDEEPTTVDDFEIEIEMTYGDTTIVRADRAAGTVFISQQEQRFFLRVANWLHYNRGKAAWTYVADAYAALLLFLACSGLFMLRGRKGLWGRGFILVVVGVAIPIVYVQLSGGP